MPHATEDKLLPYQRVGADFLAARRFCGLFDEMGLGKTIEAIEGVNTTRARRNLVIAPAIGLINWQREIESWASRRDSAIISNKNPDQLASWQIVNFELFQQPAAAMAALKKQRFDTLIVDESQSLKSHDAARTWNIYGPHGVARCADRFWALSGTPAPNHPGELYSWIVACCPSAIPVPPECDYRGRKKRFLDYQEFLDRYTKMTTTKGGFEKITGGKNMAELRERLKPHFLRRTTAEVLPEMPPVRCSRLSFAPGEGLGILDERENIAEIRMAIDAAIVKLTEGNPSVAHDDAMLEALNYIDTEWLATVRRLYGEALAPMVAEQVSWELNNGLDKIVVFYHHRAVGNVLNEMLRDARPVKVDGQTSLGYRQHCIDSFQNDPGVRVFLAQIDVAHRVITLTAAAQVLFAEASWVPGVNFQAIKRCARFGQTRSVLARFAVMAGSIHEPIMRAMIRKAQMLAELWGEDVSFNLGETEHAAFAS